MNKQLKSRSWRGVPGEVPSGAMQIAVLELCSPQGLSWRERVWLLRADGRDSLWAAVADSPDRAVPVAASDSAGTPEAAGFRLLAGYLAETSAEVAGATSASEMLPAEQIAALVSLWRDGWARH